MNSTRNKGFTLIEMMVTVAVLAIILGIGVPSFQGLIERNRISAAANSLFTSLSTARSEAIRLRQQVFLKSMSENESWGAMGWRITAINPVTNVETLIRHEIAPARTVAVKALGSIGTDIAFSSEGHLMNAGSTTASFLVCIPNSSSNSRLVTINPIGRIQSRNHSAGCPL